MYGKHLIKMIAVCGALLLSMTANAALVAKMDLNGLLAGSDKVFRGTVTAVEPGLISVGGGELPTITYHFTVDEAIKGDFGEGKAAEQVVITVLGNLKSGNTSGDYQQFSVLPETTAFQTGSEYVLFTTTPSAIGLSTTVGLEQGAFRVFANANGRDMVANGLNNAGLFSGPVSYDQLKAAVIAALNQ